MTTAPSPPVPLLPHAPHAPLYVLAVTDSAERPCGTQVQMVRDDSSITTCAAFISDADTLAAGSHNGEIRIIDALDGEVGM